jgi:hypothetical protein
MRQAARPRGDAQGSERGVPSEVRPLR